MGSVFERMMNGEEPCVRIAEDAGHAAILEPCPASAGHVVVFTRKGVDAFFDLAPEELAAFMAFAKRVAQALKAAVPCDKVAAVVYGLKVRHAHMHLIPASGAEGEIRLDKPRAKADPEALERIAAKVRAALK